MICGSLTYRSLVFMAFVVLVFVAVTNPPLSRVWNIAALLFMMSSTSITNSYELRCDLFLWKKKMSENKKYYLRLSCTNGEKLICCRKLLLFYIRNITLTIMKKPRFYTCMKNIRIRKKDNFLFSTGKKFYCIKQFSRNEMFIVINPNCCLHTHFLSLHCICFIWVSYMKIEFISVIFLMFCWFYLRSKGILKFKNIFNWKCIKEGNWSEIYHLNIRMNIYYHDVSLKTIFFNFTVVAWGLR